MSAPSSDVPVTELLGAAAAGNQEAAEQLWRLVYGELRKLAAAQLRAEPDKQVLQPTVLVHEAYLRLVGPGGAHWQSRRHFFGAAAEAMRRIRVDYARARKSLKRGGAVRVGPLGEFEPECYDAGADELLSVDEALEHLAHVDSRRAEVVKLRYFGGYTVEQVAEALGLSPRTVDNHWRIARTWLHLYLTRASTGNTEGPADGRPTSG